MGTSRSRTAALWRGTGALAKASCRCASFSPSSSCRNRLLRPPVRNPILFCARRTWCAIIPAHEVTPLEIIKERAEARTARKLFSQVGFLKFEKVACCLEHSYHSLPFMGLLLHFLKVDGRSCLETDWTTGGRMGPGLAHKARSLQEKAPTWCARWPNERPMLREWVYDGFWGAMRDCITEEHGWELRGHIAFVSPLLHFI